MPSTKSSLLLSLQQGGSHCRWTEFVEIYRPLIAHAVRQSGVARQDMDDVIQSVLLQLVKVLPSFSYQREKGFFRSWLRRVATNQAIDLRRKYRCRLGSSAAASVDILRIPATCNIDAEFDRELLQAALQCVRTEFRQKTWACFVQRMLEQKSAAQTSAELGLSENAVFINSSRVLARLREFCAFHGEELQHESLFRLVP